MASFAAKFKGWFSGEDISFSFIVALVIPVIIDQFFLVSFNFINTAMISSSGTEAVSAVNMVGSLHFFMVQVFAAVGLGGTVVISQYYGRKKLKEMGIMSASTIFGCVLMALAITITFLILRDPVLTLLFGDAEPAVMKNAQVYMTGLLLSYPMQAVVEGTNGSLRGIGRTKASLKLSLLMNSIYILCNIIFVSRLNLGVLGLTYSLNISRFIALFFALYTLYANSQLLKIRREYFRRPDFKKIRHIIRVAVPFATESLAFNGGKIIMQILIVSLGTQNIAANAIAQSWVQLSEIIPSALSTSLVPIAGQCIGRKNIKDARKLTKSFLVLGAVTFLIVDSLLLPFFNVGMKLFNPPEAVIPLIFQIFLVYYVTHFLFWSFSFILPAALRAAGDAKFTTVVSMLSMWLYRVGMGYFLGIHLGFGLLGIFGVTASEWAIRGSIFYLRFRGTKWYENELI